MRVSYTAGLWNFGVVGFMALGAYSSSLLMAELNVPFLLAFLLSGVVAGIFSFMVALPSLRLKGVYFLLLTLGFTEVVRSAAVKWLPNRIFPPPINVGGVALEGVPQYYFVLFLTLLVLYILYRLDNSRVGLTWKAISQADGLAEAAGVNVYQFKIFNFVVSCFVAGLAGSMQAHILKLVTPWGFSFNLMMYIAIWNFAGGINRFSGPIIGAFVLTLLVEPLSRLAYYETLAYAIAIIVIVFYLPGGLVSLPQKALSLFRRFGLFRSQFMGVTKDE